MFLLSLSLSLFLKRTVPDPEPDVPEEELKHARDLWTTAVSADPLAVAVDMTNITACVESKARFTQLQYKADQYVEIEVFIRYSITDFVMECMFCKSAVAHVARTSAPFYDCKGSLPFLHILSLAYVHKQFTLVCSLTPCCCICSLEANNVFPP